MYNTKTKGLTRFAFILTICTIFFGQIAVAQPDTLCYNCSGTENECAFPSNSLNLNLTEPCPDLNILFILDESGSLSGWEEEVEEAVLAFLAALIDVGPNISIIEFSRSADIVTDYTPISQDLYNDVQGYFTESSGSVFGGDFYSPFLETNWHSALIKALQIAPPDLVIFFTDGNPTVYVDSMGNNNLCGNGGSTQRPEIVNPMLLANYLKDSLGTHMFALGVGQNLSVNNIQRISGVNPYIEGVNEIMESDYYLNDGFDSLAINLRNFALQLCGVDVSMELMTSADTLCSNENPIFTYQIVNDDPIHSAFGLVLTDTFPGSISDLICLTNCGTVCIGSACTPAVDSNVLLWRIGELPAGDTAILTVQTSASEAGSETNVVWASATNIDTTSADATLMVYPAPAIDLGVDKIICLGQSVSIVSNLTSGTSPYFYEWETGDTTTTITVSPDSTKSYDLTVTDAQGCIDVGTVGVEVVELVQSSIVASEVDICIGGEVILSTLKNGGVGEYSYLWSTGSTDSTITVNPLDTTEYFVTVKDSIDCEATAFLTINVTEDPIVSVSASDFILCEGGDVELSSQVSGGVGSVAYQWQILDEGVWMDLGSGDSSVFQTPTLSVGTYEYRVGVNRNNGCEVNSDTISVTVYSDAVISVSVDNAEVCIGGNVQLSSSITGGTPNFSLQWQFSPNGSAPWTDIAGETRNTLDIYTDTTSSIYYRAAHLDTLGGCDASTSTGQLIEVFDDVSVSLSSEDLEICVGAVEQLSAIVTGGTHSTQYQWLSSLDSIVWNNVPGATSESISVYSDTAGTYYYRASVIDTNSGCSLPSPVSTKITVSPDAEVNVAASTNLSCIGTDIVLDAQLTGGSSAVQLQWQTSVDGVNAWSDIIGADQEMYTVSAIDTGLYYYRVAVSDSLLGCATPLGDAVALRFFFEPEVDAIADDTEVCIDDVVSISAIPTKGYGAYAYEWNTGSTDSVIIVAVTDTTTYTVTVTDAISCSTSKSVVVNVSALPTLSISSDNYEMCEGGQATFSSSVVGNAEAVTYQWQKYELNNWVDVVGAESALFTSAALDSGSYLFRLSINPGANCAVNSDSSLVVVTKDASVTLVPNEINGCIGADISMDILAENGTSQSKVVLQHSHDGLGGWTEVTLVDSMSYTVNTDTAGVRYYRAHSTDTLQGCSTALSSVHMITVSQDIIAQLSFDKLEMCVGGVAQLDAIVSGGANALEYEWSSSLDSIIWDVLVVETADNLSVNTASVGTTYYRAIVSDASAGCDESSEAYAKVSVMADAEVNVAASTNLSCIGTDIVLDAQLTGGSSAVQLQWQTSVDGVNAWSDIIGADQEMYTVSAIDTGLYYYRVVVSDSLLGCATPLGDAVALRFFFEPEVDAIADDTEVCIDDVVSISAIPTKGYGAYAYEWNTGSTDSVIIVAVTDTTTYTVTVTDAISCSTSKSVVVNVSALPTLSISSDNYEMCEGGQATFSSSVVGNVEAVTYQWQRYELNNWVDVVGAESALFTSAALDSGSYLFRLSINPGANCAVNSDSSLVVVTKDASVTLVPNEINGCIGADISMDILAENGTSQSKVVLQHSHDGLGGWTEVTLVDSMSYTVNTDTAGVRYYRAHSTDTLQGCSTALSSVHMITVSQDIIAQLSFDKLEMCVGGVAQLDAIVSGGANALEYEWSSSLDSIIWDVLVVETADNLSVNTASVGTTYYRAIVSDASAGCDESSEAYAKVSVMADAEVNVAASTNLSCIGTDIVLDAQLTGGSSAVQLQWQTSVDGVNAWSDIIGADQEMYTVSAIDTGLYYYRVVVSDSLLGCATPLGDAVALRFFFEPEVDAIADDTEVCIDDVVSISAIPTKGYGAYAYEWNTGSTDSVIIVAVTDTTTYTVTVTDAISCSTSKSVVVNVSALPTLSISSDNYEMCEGGQATFSSSVVGNVEAVTYQWQRYELNNWVDVVGAESALFTSAALDSGSYLFRLSINPGANCAVNSDSSLVVVTKDASVTLVPNETDVCVGADVSIEINVQNGSSLNEVILQYSIDGLGGWIDVVLVDSMSYDVNTDTSGDFYFRATVIDTLNGCNESASEIQLVSVRDDLTLALISQNIELCVGGTTQLEAIKTGGTSASQYVWHFSNDSIVWTEMIGENSEFLSLSADSVSEIFYRVSILDASIGCNSPEPVVARVLVVPDAQISVIATTDESCVGGQIVLDAQISGGSSNSHVQWQSSLDGISNWINIDGATDELLAVEEIDSGNYFFRVLLIDSLSGCLNPESDLTEVSFYLDPILSISSNDSEVCLGDSLKLSASTDFGSGQFSYQWQRRSLNDINWVDVVGAELVDYYPSTNTIDTTLYRVVLSDAVVGCGNAISDSSLVLIIQPPVAVLSIEHATCDLLNGSITIEFLDDPNRGSVEFSIDGGNNYMPSIDDSSTSVTYNNLSPGVYDVIARWDNDECPTSLGIDTIRNIECGSISGLVSELSFGPLPNVTLNLYADSDSNGVAEGTILASSLSEPISGAYEFTLVPVGNYVITQIQPASYSSISDYDHTTGVFDPDGVDTAGVGANNSIPVTIIADEIDADNNFIELADFGLISGYVLHDGGLGINNVTLRLYLDTNGDGVKDGSQLEQVKSASDGYYEFNSIIPGDYVVVENQPFSYISISDFDETADPDGDDRNEGVDNDIPVTVIPGENDSDNNFREGRNGSITGSVKNQSGVAMHGVLISLYADADSNGLADGPVISTATSDYSLGGLYFFASVPAGNYVLVETQPFLYSDISDYDITTGAFDPDGLDSLGGPDNDIPVSVTYNENDSGNNFVNGAPGSICGRVVTDTGNPISNVKIWLYADDDADGEPDGEPLDSVYSEGDSGNFCFSDIQARDYVLVEEHPEYYTSVSDYDHSISASDPDGDDTAEGPNEYIPVTLTAGEEEDEDNIFTEDPYPGVIVGATVNQDNEPIENVLIKLYFDIDQDGTPDGPILDSIRTNIIGEFSFSGVEPNGYLLIEEQPANYSSISDFDITEDGDGNDNHLGSNDQIPVIIYAGETDDGNVFVEGSPGSICGNVRDDIGGVIPSVLIELYLDLDSNSTPDIKFDQVYSDSITGNYCFDNLAPAQYVLVETQPADYESISDFDHSIDSIDPDGDDSALGFNNIIPVSLSPGEPDAGNDFIELPDSSSIGGYVENEIGGFMFGVKIKLYSDYDLDGIEDGLALDSILTDFSGEYLFQNLHPGAYVLVETQPFLHGSIEDYDITPDPDGDDRADGADNNIPVILKAGEEDFGNVFINSRPGSICGRVVTDTGNPISNVKIWLYGDDNADGEPDGEPLDSVYSEGDSGNFCFSDIVTRDYVLVEEHPQFYSSVSDYDHSIIAGDLDGDDTAEGPNEYIPVTLTAGEEDEDNIFTEDPYPGVIIGAVVNQEDEAIEDVLISLYFDINQDGIPEGPVVDTTRTNIIGEYTFSGVEPDGYLLIEEQPANYSSISDFDITEDGDGNDNHLGSNDQIPVIIYPGETDDGNVFVEGSPGSICGNVRDDIGGVVPSVVIELYLDIDSNSTPDIKFDQVLSDSITGNYCFDNVVPGPYVLLEVQPADYESISDFDHSIDSIDTDGDDSALGFNNMIPVLLNPGESDSGNDFIELPDSSSIGGYVENEVGGLLFGVKIKLFSDYDLDGIEDGLPLDSVVTDVSGAYLFPYLHPGAYVLVETQPIAYGNIEDYDITPDPDGDDRADGADNNIPVILMAGEEDFGNVFFDSRPGSICGSVHDDLGNPLSNVPIVLFFDDDNDGSKDGQPLDTVYSEGDSGNYCFTDIEPRNYVVVEMQLATYGDLYDYDESIDSFDLDGLDSLGGPDNDIPVTLLANEQDEDNNFVDISCPSSPQIIGDSLQFICHGEIVVFNADQQNLGSEEYVWSFGDGATPANAIGAGPHEVVYDTTSLNQSIGAAVSLTISKTGCGTQASQVGNIIVRTAPDATISADTTDLCWYAYRSFKPLKPEIAGATYTWDFGYGAVPATATGYGPHDVTYTETSLVEVSLSIQSSYAETNCMDTSNFLFNVYECLGNIAGSVTTTEGDPIGNVLILLYEDEDLNGLPPSDENDFYDFTFTTINGQYAFVNIRPGNYVIKEFQPEGYFSVLDDDFSFDNDSIENINKTDDLIPVTVEPLISDFNNDFIESVILGSIEGFVFEDINGNNAVDDGEGIDSVWLRLYSDIDKDGNADSNVPVDSVMSDLSGMYSFSNVSPMSYVIVEEQPELYWNGQDIDASEDVDEVVNLNQTNDTIPVTVEPGELDKDNFFLEVKIISNLVTNTNDVGPGSLRYAVENTAPGDTVWFDPPLAGDTIRITSELISVQKNLVIYASPMPRIQVKSSVSGLFDIHPGQQVEIYNLGLMSGESGNPAVIDNSGVLILNNVDIYRNPLLPVGSQLLRNQSEIIVRGVTRVNK